MKSPYFLTLALALAACSGADKTAPTETTTVANESGPETVPPLTGSPTTPVDAASYVEQAGAGDLWEIESSKALLAKSGDAGVKRFAQMMIDHHAKSTAKIKEAAVAASIEVPAPKLDVAQQKKLGEIEAADAAGIDALYIAYQKAAHDAALALHKGYASDGDTAGLKKVAGEIVPVVESHRTELAKLAPAN